MTSECRPPEGTPDGAWCIIQTPQFLLSLPPQPVFERWQWRGVQWSAPARAFEPHTAYLFGYRFHSLATPPENKP